MKKILSALLLATVVSASALAQEYKGSLLYDVKGDVKEMKVKSKNPLARYAKKLKFADNGQRINDYMTYNDAGLPIGYGMNLGGKVRTLKVEYDASERPSVITMSVDGAIMRIENVYEGDRLASRRLSSPVGTRETVWTYSDEKRDARGNWTERRVSETVTDRDPSKSGTETYTETREITYR